MLVQAAKVIGSGLATIGLTSILISLLTDNRQYLLSPVIQTNLVKKAIDNLDIMILNLPKNSLLLNFLNEEIPRSLLKINGTVINGKIDTKYYVDLSLNNIDEQFKNLLDIDFLIAGVYAYISPNEK